MTIAALIALLPTLISGASEVANIIQEMHASGATETDQVQTERLAAALGRRKAADAGYDSATLNG